MGIQTVHNKDNFFFIRITHICQIFDFLSPVNRLCCSRIPTWRTPLRGSTNTKILIALLHLYLELIFWTSPGRGDRGSLTSQAVSMAFRPCRLQIPRFLEGYTNSH